MFGNTSSPFGQKAGTTGFGQQSTFGNTNATAFGTPQPTPGFGQTTSTPVFGQTPNFGQPSATPSFGATTMHPAFGAAATQPGFGSSVAQPAFGASTSQPAFGAAATQPAFGTPATQTAFGAAPTGQPAFGAAPSGQPAFGAAPSGQPSFGAAPSGQPSFAAATLGQPSFGAAPSGQPAFGTPTTTASQTTFGAQSAQPAAFGTPATQTAAFGTSSAQPAFGNPTAQTGFGTPTAQTGFGTPTAQTGFGTPSAQTGFGTPSAQTGFGTPTATATFGAPAVTPSLGLAAPTFSSTPLNQKPGFGTTTQSTLNFGIGNTQTTTTATTQSGFSFGTNAVPTGFGAPTSSTLTPATQPTLSFNLPQTTNAGLSSTKAPALSFGAPAATTQASLSFGSSLTAKPATSTAAQPNSFNMNLGATALSATTQHLSSGLGLNSLSYNSTPIGGKSMLTITGNTTTPLYGSKSSDLNASKTQGQIPPKGQTVHPLVIELVESFKNHLKSQKHLCLEVSRASLKPINKISSDTENIKKSVMKLERAVNKNKMLNSKLKEETVKTLADVEIAQKAMDYPGGFPCDNSIVTEYFLHLANKFQAQVVALRIELENTEKSIMCELNPTAFTPQELSTTMQRLYECFVALAGRFQFVHAQISNLKIQHLELRKKKLEDYTDIFSKKNFAMRVMNDTNDAVSLSTGPSPFAGFRNYHSLGAAASRLTPQAPDNSLASLANTAHSLLSSTLNKSVLQNNSLLSSPSVVPGSKRGKR